MVPTSTVSLSRGWTALCLFALLSSGCEQTSKPTPEHDPATTAPAFVGRQVCASCHPMQTRSWRGSHHDLAMQEANARTVLGDFEDSAFTHDNVTTTFFRRDNDFFVRTEGPDSAWTEYRIAYTFGVEPLQQYLIAFPDGRVQALSIGWDTRPAEEGGQRWFHLYPDETIEPRDPLHWTGPLQNWNFMCAECHSTDLRKQYDPTEDRYATTFSEIDVSCEACHGPASRHVAWAAQTTGRKIQGDPDFGLVHRLVGLDEGGWTFAHDGPSGTARRTIPRQDRSEVETCGRCHARRAPLTEPYEYGTPLTDGYHLQLLDEALYHADGQIKDEVYVYGSFLQSKMYREGVTCSDCHDPHTGKTLALGQGVVQNVLCARCHLPATFDTTEHHHHPEAAAVRCVDCHMPETTYMVVDPRRDHSLRVPRPDLTLKIGTPNACNACHRDREADWAVDAVKRWYGPERGTTFHYGEALHAARTWQTGADALLRRVIEDAAVPGIARATAVELLARFPSPDLLPVLDQARVDRDPLVRRAAARSFETLEPSIRAERLIPLLQDTLRSVRLQAARALADVPKETFEPTVRTRVERALEEYRAVQRRHADRAESHLELGWLDLQDGRPEAAEAAYRTALRRQPRHIPAHVNLADLYRMLGREDEAEALLRRALEIAPQDAAVHHALGLSQVRQLDLDTALMSLARAAELRPQEPQYAYVHGVALASAGQSARALEILEQAHQRFPAHRELLFALATTQRNAGRFTAARSSAQRLVELIPWDPQATRVLQSLPAPR